MRNIPQEEKFIPIPNFSEYLINKKGQVYSLLANKIRKPVSIKNGYMTVLLRKDGKYILRYIHRLVAEVFLENPRGLPQVNHIDGDKTNNNLLNLEWISVSGNLKHSYRELGRKRSRYLLGKTGYSHHLSQEVLQISPDGFIINVFGSCREAAKQTNIPKSTILKCRANKTKYAGGYIWK